MNPSLKELNYPLDFNCFFLHFTGLHCVSKSDETQIYLMMLTATYHLFANLLSEITLQKLVDLLQTDLPRLHGGFRWNGGFQNCPYFLGDAQTTSLAWVPGPFSDIYWAGTRTYPFSFPPRLPFLPVNQTGVKGSLISPLSG